MSDRSVIPLSAQPQMGKLDEAEYFRLLRRVAGRPQRVLGPQGKRVDWIKPYTKVMNASFDGDVSIKWYEDGTLNASANCIDRHLATARRPGRDPVGGRRPGRRPQGHLSRIA